MKTNLIEITVSGRTDQGKSEFFNVPERRTGKTFGLVLRCLDLASSGEKVIIWVSSTDHARDLFHRFWPFAMNYSEQLGRTSLKFENGGELRILSKNSNVRGYFTR